MTQSENTENPKKSTVESEFSKVAKMVKYDESFNDKIPMGKTITATYNKDFIIVYQAFRD